MIGEKRFFFLNFLATKFSFCIRTISEHTNKSAYLLLKALKTHCVEWPRLIWKVREG